MNFARFYDIDPDTVSEKAIESSSAGVRIWAESTVKDWDEMEDSDGRGSTPVVDEASSQGNSCCFTSPNTIAGMNVQQKQDAGWTRMGITVDSGAADSVASPLSFPGYNVVEHPSPQLYQSATGEPIVNLGEQTIAMVTDEGTLGGMTFQASKKVKKPLASVKKIVTANHAVVFASDEMGGSFILNLDTGEMNQLRKADGNYMLDVWVPPAIEMKGFGRQP